MKQIPNTQKATEETMEQQTTKRSQIHQSTNENKSTATSTKHVNKSTMKTTDNKATKCNATQITETKQETMIRINAKNEWQPKMKQQTTATTSTLKPNDKTIHKRNKTNEGTASNNNTTTKVLCFFNFLQKPKSYSKL